MPYAQTAPPACSACERRGNLPKPLAPCSRPRRGPLPQEPSTWARYVQVPLRLLVSMINPQRPGLAFAGEPKGSSAVMAPASGPLRGRCGPGCPAMGARSLQAAHCSARPHSQPQGIWSHAAVRRGSPRLHRHADPLPSQNCRFSSAQLDCLFRSIRRVGWPELALRPLPAGAPFPLGVSAAVGSRPTARAAAPRAEWASPGPSSGKKNSTDSMSSPAW